jgi:hypothetical protein
LTGNTAAIDPRTAIATARGHGIFMILVLFIFCTKTFKISTENLILSEGFQMEFSFFEHKFVLMLIFISTENLILSEDGIQL